MASFHFSLDTVLSRTRTRISGAFKTNRQIDVKVSELLYSESLPFSKIKKKKKYLYIYMFLYIFSPYELQKLLSLNKNILKDCKAQESQERVKTDGMILVKNTNIYIYIANLNLLICFVFYIFYKDKIDSQLKKIGYLRYRARNCL